MVLWEADEQTVTAIAHRLYLESNTLTPLIKRMEAMKIVNRRKSNTDARQTIVSLTAHGRALEHEAAKIPGCMSALLCEKGIENGDFMQIVPILDKFIEALSKARE